MWLRLLLALGSSSLLVASSSSSQVKQGQERGIQAFAGYGHKFSSRTMFALATRFEAPSLRYPWMVSSSPPFWFPSVQTPRSRCPSQAPSSHILLGKGCPVVRSDVFFSSPKCVEYCKRWFSLVSARWPPQTSRIGPIN